MNVQIEESWKAHLEPEFEKDYFRTLTDFVKSEYSQYQIFPPGKLIFNAFNLCPFDKVKVVIIGQDPYHGPGQAHGLCFSVNDGVPFPPSLVNIFKEIKEVLQLRPYLNVLLSQLLFYASYTISSASILYFTENNLGMGETQASFIYTGVTAGGIIVAILLGPLAVKFDKTAYFLPKI
mgnify:CR=1 FL=1